MSAKEATYTGGGELKKKFVPKVKRNVLIKTAPTTGPTNPLEGIGEIILDDIFMSGSMPKLSAFLHSYEFYPPDVDPENLAVMGHVEVYRKHIPFLCLYYANIILRGVGQVYICNNPATGLMVCIGLCITSPTLMMYALLGAIFANLGAYVICPPSNDEIESGLFGYVTHSVLPHITLLTNLILILLCSFYVQIRWHSCWLCYLYILVSKQLDNRTTLSNQ